MSRILFWRFGEAGGAYSATLDAGGAVRLSGSAVFDAGSVYTLAAGGIIRLSGSGFESWAEWLRVTSPLTMAVAVGSPVLAPRMVASYICSTAVHADSGMSTSLLIHSVLTRAVHLESKRVPPVLLTPMGREQLFSSPLAPRSWDFESRVSKTQNLESPMARTLLLSSTLTTAEALDSDIDLERTA